MKMIIVPGFLGYAQETHHMELKSKMESLGHEAIVIESIELAQLDFANYRFSSQLREVEKCIDLNPNDQFAVAGVSMGGVLACYASLGRSNVTHVACIVSPYQFACGDDMEAKLESWKSNGKMQFVSSKYGELSIPYEFIDDAQKYNALDIVGKLKCKKLFLAGSDDERVPHALTESLAMAACEPKMYRLVNGMRHDYKNQPQYKTMVNDNILDFIFG